MLRRIRDLLASALDTIPEDTTPKGKGSAEVQRPCKHNYCASFPTCLKEQGCLPSLPRTSHSLSSDYFNKSSRGNSVFSWDSDEGWEESCELCKTPRCDQCGGEEGVFTSNVGIHETLTLEHNEVNICTPCQHGVCPGWVMMIICVCRECGHEACDICVKKSKEMGSGVCCKGCVPTAPAPAPFVQTPTVEPREEGAAGRHFEDKFERLMAGEYREVDSEDSDSEGAVEVESIDDSIAESVLREEMEYNKGSK